MHICGTVAQSTSQFTVSLVPSLVSSRPPFSRLASLPRRRALFLCTALLRSHLPLWFCLGGEKLHWHIPSSAGPGSCSICLFPLGLHIITPPSASSSPSASHRLKSLRFSLMSSSDLRRRHCMYLDFNNSDALVVYSGCIGCWSSQWAHTPACTQTAGSNSDLVGAQPMGAHRFCCQQQTKNETVPGGWG
jgi:hypothetical protein